MFIEPCVEDELALSIFSWRDVGPGILVVGERSDGLGVVGFVGQQGGARFEDRQQVEGGFAVVGLAGGQVELDRASLGIDNGVDLGGQTTFGAAHSATVRGLRVLFFR